MDSWMKKNPNTLLAIALIAAMIYLGFVAFGEGTGPVEPAPAQSQHGLSESVQSRSVSGSLLAAAR